MKTKLIYIMCLITAGLFQSCTSEVDDLFDTPSQQRLNADLKACRELLVSAEKGWKLDYYPSTTQAYGGYAMTVKFTETNVTAASEISGDPAMTVTSLYSLKSDMGPTLNFDTYNNILHFFANPDYSAGAGLGKGYEGDYEFVIQSHSENEIILKGKKTKNLMRMTRLTESSETYLASVMSMSEKVASVMGILGYSGIINGQNVTISLPSDRRMNIQIGNDKLEKTGYMYTSAGIQLYQPITIGEKEVSTLEWSDDQKTFLSPDKVALTPVQDPEYPKYLRFLGEYTMTYTSGNSDRSVDINLTLLMYTPNRKMYLVEGLPFPLEMYYNVESDCMEILAYTMGSYYVAMWEVIGKGSLSWGAGLGMVGKLREGTDNVYDFVDNGTWGSNEARAIILWSPGGEYKDFGGDTRFQYIAFTKK